MALLTPLSTAWIRVSLAMRCCWSSRAFSAWMRSVTLREMRLLARRHLMEARERGGALPEEVLPAFLPVSVCDLYLKRLERLGARAMKRVADVSQIRRQWRMLWYAMNGRF